ncbi:unnamed protein product [Caenorhabditis auriculariae]|uniref:Cytosolic fatty-acid binding proteins domain-containing protein n=1 Tax=Caenorhabditis auriculariae TaxID=2777116 RepID=A0A8S1GUM0_9PELO|nr:unnamed protein product [Caenorhabditis auriculariae]
MATCDGVVGSRLLQAIDMGRRGTMPTSERPQTLEVGGARSSRMWSPVLSLALLAFVCHSALAAQTLPDKFYGNFVLDHSENFDEYLTAKGYSWLTRKIVTFATFKKQFKKTSDPKKFDYANLTSKKDVHYKDISLETPFVGEGLDGKQHEVTFSLKNGHLFEHHKPKEEGGEAKEETYEYLFEGDFLLVRMTYNNVEGRRYYKREN